MYVRINVRMYVRIGLKVFYRFMFQSVHALRIYATLHTLYATERVTKKNFYPLCL